MTGPRSTSRSISEPDGLVVGVIKTPHGVRGEVRVDPRSDVPDRFRVGASLECDGLGALTIRSIRGTPQEPIVGSSARSFAMSEPASERSAATSSVEPLTARSSVSSAYCAATAPSASAHSVSSAARSALGSGDSVRWRSRIAATPSIIAWWILT